MLNHWCGCSKSDIVHQKVEIVNRKTGGKEIVKLINCDPDDFLGAGETEVSSNKYIWCPQSPLPSIPLSLGSVGKHM